MTKRSFFIFNLFSKMNFKIYRVFSREQLQNRGVILEIGGTSDVNTALKSSQRADFNAVLTSGGPLLFLKLGMSKLTRGKLASGNFGLRKGAESPQK